MNLPLMYLGAVILGAIAGAVGNAYQEHDIGQSAICGILEGIAIATTVYLCYIIFGVRLI